MEHLTRAEFLAHIEPMKKSIESVLELQKEQNGKVGAHETRIAVLEERSPKREASGISALVSAIISGLAWWASSQK